MRPSANLTCACALVVLTTGAALLPAAAADVPSNVRGTVVSKTAASVTVQTASGPVAVDLTPKTRYAGAVKGSPADITSGAFLGIASVQSGGMSRALEVTVFPNSMRGAGEGDYPWDLTSGGAHSAMTNGTAGMGAATKPHSMMTNATASKASGNGATVTMTYKGGSRTIAIPPNAAIVKLVPGSSKLVMTGAHVFVRRVQVAGKVIGAAVIVGQNGTIPPM